MHRRRSTNVPPSFKLDDNNDDVFLVNNETDLLLPSDWKMKNPKFVKFLRKHSLDSYMQIFEKQEIDMEVFVTLDKKDLHEIGINENEDFILDIVSKVKKPSRRHFF